MPAPSPVPASDPTAPRCSRWRSASSARAMMSWPAVPRSVATMARPHASFSRRGSYSPCAAGTPLNPLYGLGAGAECAMSTVLTMVLEMGRQWPNEWRDAGRGVAGLLGVVDRPACAQIILLARARLGVIARIVGIGVDVLRVYLRGRGPLFPWPV